MKLPELKNPQKYTGLYILDFGSHAGVGFTAQEVAELLESEKYKDCKVYKIHRAHPDGTLEIRGIPREVFECEAGVFFYSTNIQTAQDHFANLVDIATHSAPPCRAKVHLAKYTANKFVTALIYPAEYDDEISSWLLQANYLPTGAIEGGIQATERYYNTQLEVLQRHQLSAYISTESRSGAKLLACVRQTIQR